MNNELATVRPAINSLETKIKYAQAMASASLLPKAYANNPANVLIAVELGESLGISSIQAINGIHVIEGKPSASADLIASLVRRAGHKLRVTVDDAELIAVAQIIRADDPDFTYESRWDMDKANKAGLVRKGGNWEKHPGQMLRSRAITEVCRMGASDALYGVIYTPEELGADMTADGDVVAPRAAPVAAGKPPTIQEAIAARQMFEDSAEPELRTEAQAKKLAVVLREMGMTNRDETLAELSGVIGRDLDSTKHLTVVEASTVIDYLESIRHADPETGEVVDAELVELPGMEPTEHARETQAQAAASWGDS